MDYEPFSPTPHKNLFGEARQIASVCFSVVALFLVTYLVEWSASFLILASFPSAIERPGFEVAFSSIPMYLFGVPLASLFFRLGKSDPPTEKTKFGLPAMLGSIVICLGLSLLGSLLGQAANGIRSAIEGREITNPVNDLLIESPFWINLLFVGILAPVMEEFFFRRMMISRLRRYGDLTAVLVSGILFGAIHGNFSQFFYAACIGIFFGAVYCKTGRLANTVLLHTVFNCIGVFVAEAQKHVNTDTLANLTAEELIPILPWVLLLLGYTGVLVLSLVATPFLCYFLFRRDRPKPPAVRLTPSELSKVLLLNPAVWMLGGLVILLFFTT